MLLAGLACFCCRKLSSQPSTVCLSVVNNCIFSLNANKIGCVADLIDPIRALCHENGKSDECRTCNSSNCNTKAMFAKCFHCDSALDPQCAINPQPHDFSKVCNAYADECYTYISKFNVTRGCLAEQHPDFRNDECKNAQQKCAICSDTNGFGCNDRTIFMETCVHCNTANGENCFDDLHMFKGKICSDIDSTEKEGCYLSIGSQSVSASISRKSLDNIFICFSFQSNCNLTNFLLE